MRPRITDYVLTLTVALTVIHEQIKLTKNSRWLDVWLNLKQPAIEADG